MELTVVDNTAQRRFEIHADGVLAGFMQYHVEEPGTYALTHTQTLPAFAGQGIAGALLTDVIGRMRAGNFSILPYCPFVNAYLRRHPEDAELVPLVDRVRFGVGV